MNEYTLHLGDCLEFMRGMDAGSVDAVITDPPYPDYYTDLYVQTGVGFLTRLACRQLVFWSSHTDFTLDFTARHVWNKNPSNHGAQYEFIYERNGGNHQKVFTFYMVNSTVAADMTNDIFTGHPSQKPIKLIQRLILEFTSKGDLVFDPFMGSGTTGVACMQLGRRFIGCEIDPAYYAIAERRIADAAAQPALFHLDAPKIEATQEALL